MSKVKQTKNRWRKSVFILLVLAIVAMANVLALVSTDKFGLKWDLTQEKLYDLTDTTQDVVAQLNTTIELVALDNQDSMLDDVDEVLQRYDNLSDQISLTYVDLVENATFYQTYAQAGTTLVPGGVIVRCGEQEQVFSWEDLYTIDEDTAQATAFLAEQQITSAIAYLTSGVSQSVAFTQGHNETVGEELKGIFTQNHYDTVNLTLSVQDIPDDLDLLVICGPLRDFDQSEIQKIDQFMAKGGALLVFLNPSATVYPNLNDFLEEWGIVPGGYTVFEPQNNMGNASTIVPLYYSHTINNYFSSNQYFMVMPQSMTLSVYEREGKLISPVLISTENSYGKAGDLFTTTDRASEDVSGPFILAATSEQTVLVDGESQKAQLFVIGNKSVYDDETLAVSSYANRDFLIQVINWAAEGMELVDVPARDLSASQVVMMPTVSLALCAMLTVVMPLVILGYGVAVFLKRRHQ